MLGRALELAVLVLIMGLIQREMVAHSWTMITIDAVEHSRAVRSTQVGRDGVLAGAAPASQMEQMVRGPHGRDL